jgi:hypothetical protein
VLLVGKPVGKFSYFVGKQKRTGVAYEIVTDGPMRPVSPAELCAWVQRHEVERFEQWRYRKVWDAEPRARKEYQTAERRSSPTDRNGSVGVGATEPVEIITDPGEYHYEWIRGGRRIPPLRAAESQDDAE